MIWYSTKIIDKFDILICIAAIAIPVIFCNILFYIIISLSNNYKRKQFVNIKENGNYYKGIILTVGYQSKGYSRSKWLMKDTGEISVEVNNKVYKIKDIDYNDEFKLLENSLDECLNTLHTNVQQFNNFISQRQGRINKGSSILKNTQREIDIYVLDDKVVADLESIKIN